MKAMPLFLAFLVAQGAAGQDRGEADRSFAGRIGDDMGLVWSECSPMLLAPFRFRETDWNLTNGAFAGTLLLSTRDVAIRSAFERSRSRFGDGLSDVGEQYGKNVNIAMLCGAIYLGGVLSGNDGVRTTGRLAIEATLVTGFWTTVIKTAVGRSRPFLEQGAHDLHGPAVTDDQLSLPSGHAALSFAFSTLLARRIHSPAASAGLYALAVITALSRVYQDDHWASDTFLGAVLGTSIGWSVGRGDENHPETSLLSIIPAPGRISVALRF